MNLDLWLPNTFGSLSTYRSAFLVLVLFFFSKYVKEPRQIAEHVTADCVILTGGIILDPEVWDYSGQDLAFANAAWSTFPIPSIKHSCFCTYTSHYCANTQCTWTKHICTASLFFSFPSLGHRQAQAEGCTFLHHFLDQQNEAVTTVSWTSFCPSLTCSKKC